MWDVSGPINSVQRDYMAGEISKDLTARLLLDPEIVKAHQEGLIHFHDSDYFAQHMHNCDLVNLEDMLPPLPCDPDCPRRNIDPA